MMMIDDNEIKRQYYRSTDDDRSRVKEVRDVVATHQSGSARWHRRKAT